MGINRSRHTDKLLGALDIIGFAVCCYSAVAYRHFILHIENHSLRNLLQLGNRGRARVHEQQETCESQKHPVGKNQKRSAGGVHELQKTAKQNKNKCAEQHGDMPCTGNESPRSKLKQICRTTWRYATKEEQKISQKTMPKSLVSQYCCD